MILLFQYQTDPYISRTYKSNAMRTFSLNDPHFPYSTSSGKEFRQVHRSSSRYINNSQSRKKFI
jgi:hypothetical protein